MPLDPSFWYGLTGAAGGVGAGQGGVARGYLQGLQGYEQSQLNAARMRNLEEAAALRKQKEQERQRKLEAVNQYATALEQSANPLAAQAAMMLRAEPNMLNQNPKLFEALARGSEPWSTLPGGKGLYRPGTGESQLFPSQMSTLDQAKAEYYRARARNPGGTGSAAGLTKTQAQKVREGYSQMLGSEAALDAYEQAIDENPALVGSAAKMKESIRANTESFARVGADLGIPGSQTIADKAAGMYDENFARVRQRAITILETMKPFFTKENRLSDQDYKRLKEAIGLTGEGLSYTSVKDALLELRSIRKRFIAQQEAIYPGITQPVRRATAQFGTDPRDKQLMEMLGPPPGAD